MKGGPYISSTRTTGQAWEMWLLKMLIPGPQGQPKELASLGRAQDSVFLILCQGF